MCFVKERVRSAQHSMFAVGSLLAENLLGEFVFSSMHYFTVSPSPSVKHASESESSQILEARAAKFKKGFVWSNGQQKLNPATYLDGNFKLYQFTRKCFKSKISTYKLYRRV